MKRSGITVFVAASAMHAGLIFRIAGPGALLISLAMSPPAAAQDTTPDRSDHSTGEIAETISAESSGERTGALPLDLQRELSREIARLTAEIDEIRQLRRWQENLIRIARTNPEEARRLRRPMAECRASVLAPLCDQLTALFQPDADGTPDPADPTVRGEGME